MDKKSSFSRSWLAKTVVMTMLLAMLAAVAISCSGADDTPAAQVAAPAATSAPVVSSEAAPDPTATPTPSYDTTLYGATYYKRDQNVETEQVSTRPVITQDVIDRMPLMKIDEVTKWIPQTWQKTFEYEDIKRGGTFINAVNWDIAKWDPRLTAAGGTMAVGNMVYMALLKFKTGVGEDPVNPPLTPRLAESWEFSGDSMTATFKIHKGIHWGDINDPYQLGPEVVADDIKWSLLQLRDNSVHSGAFATIESIDTPDSHTLVLNFSSPSLWLLPNLAIKDHPIVNRHLFEADRQNFEAVGPGPFILESAKKSVKVTMKANPNYFFKDERGGQLPYVDGVTFLIVPDASTKVAMLRTGRTDYAYGATSGRIEEFGKLLESQPEMIGYPSQTGYACCISFQQNDPIWGNVDARRAASLAIDSKGIGDVLFGYNHAPVPLRAAWFFFMDEMPSWDDDLDALYGDYVWHYDVAKAQELWDSTGFGEIEESIEYYAYSTAYTDTLALVVEDLKKIGIKAKIDSRDYSAYNGPLAAGELPGIFWSWAASFPGLASMMYFRYNVNGTVNRENINDPLVNDLTTQMRDATNEEDMLSVLQPLRERILDQVFHMEMPRAALAISCYCMQGWVKNYQQGSYSGGYYYWGHTLDAIWLDREH
jgi:ABC-type transport system substrate-binding protein